MLPCLVLSLVFFSVSLVSLAQPGGGGGVEIKDICDVNGKFRKELRFRFFQLRGGPGSDPAYEDDRVTELNTSWSEPHWWIYIQGETKRMCIFSAQDTMIIDFYNLLGSNPMGTRDYIDKLTFESGYFQCNMNGNDEEGLKRDEFLKKNIPMKKLLDYPTTAETFWRRGVNLSYSPSHDSAIYCFKESLKSRVTPLDLDTKIFVMCAMADEYRKMNSKQDALDAVNEAIKLTNNQGGPLKARSDLYLHFGDTVTAIADFRKAGESPQSVSYFLYGRLKRYSEAIDFLQEQIEKTPLKSDTYEYEYQSPTAWMHMDCARIYKGNGDFEKGRQSIIRASELNFKENYFASFALHYCDILIGHFPKDPELHVAKARFIVRAQEMKWNNWRPGMLDSARHELDRALQLDSNLYTAWLEKGIVYWVNNEQTKALEAIETAFRLNGTEPRVKYWRCNIRTPLEGDKSKNNRNEPCREWNSLPGIWSWR